MRMQFSKFVVKCGNYAVLVDLHILPLGSQDNASWFSPEHRKEVGSLIRDALEPRVRQFQEARYQKIQPKPRKDLTLTAPLCLEGGNVRLAVHFMKRHINLRCIVRQCYRELRVFPERVLVCASPPENSALPSGNLNLDVSEQSQSKYFSGSAETIDPLPRSTATKRAILQKLARQAIVQTRQRQDDQDFKSIQFQMDEAENESTAALQIARQVDVQPQQCQDDKESLSSEIRTDTAGKGSSTVLEKVTRQANIQPRRCQDYRESRSSQIQADETEKAFAKACHPVSSESREDGEAVLSSKLSNSKEATEPRLDTTSSRRRPRSSSGEDVDSQKTKRSRVKESVLSSGIEPPDSVCSPQPEISQTNQSGLAASLRGLKPVSSGSSISSRLAPGEGRKGGEPRTSRLRRLKKS